MSGAHESCCRRATVSENKRWNRNTSAVRRLQCLSNRMRKFQTVAENTVRFAT